MSICGPLKMGKSYFLKYNLKTYEKQGINYFHPPLVIFNFFFYFIIDFFYFSLKNT